jgi:hypothetical protein
MWSIFQWLLAIAFVGVAIWLFFAPPSSRIPRR